LSTTVLSVRMELLSDTLFGSGFSLSGGADLSAKRDEEGFPYVSGTTFKGLLREVLSQSTRRTMSEQRRSKPLKCAMFPVLALI